jgi:hypothetical protein
MLARVLVRAALIVAVASTLPATARAQQSRCADCHFANPPQNLATPSGDATRHLRDWDLSAHAKANVGCERCHGGDASTFEPLQAHRTVLHWSNPAAPVYRANLPRTCGGCHAGPFAAFQKSRHYALLQSGNRDVPTCATCHGEAGENRPSPKSLESQCRSCHRADRPGGHPEHPALGRKMLEGVRDTRTQLKEARRLIERVSDKARRTRLEQAAQQVDVPLTEATQAGHAFVYTNLEERLGVARQRLAALFDSLANPPR